MFLHQVLSSFIIGCAYLGISAHAYPSVLEKRGVTPYPLSQLALLRPLSHFAAAAYCLNNTLAAWTCGYHCQANKDFKITKPDGDGFAIQKYFVGFSPSQRSVIVSHQGTDPLSLQAVMTDINIPLVNLNAGLFPGIPSSVKVHTGFRDQHAKTAAIILNLVKKTMKDNNSYNVTTVGHSLGGALAELDALYLSLNLPANTLISTYTYGAPRVGNPAFAQLLDTKVPKTFRINNMKDVTPIVPGVSLGYQHAGQEIHILSTSSTFLCSGRDNSVDPQCTYLTVPTIFAGNIFDHLGPYDGVRMGGTLEICL